MSVGTVALLAGLSAGVAVVLLPSSRSGRRPLVAQRGPMGAPPTWSGAAEGEGHPRQGAAEPGRPSSGLVGRGWVVPGRGAARRRAHGDRQLLALLDLVVPALRAGLPVVVALDGAAGSARSSAPPRLPWPGWRVVGVPRPGSGDDWVARLRLELLAEAATGRPLAGVWAEHARRARSLEGAFVARAWALSEALGAPLAESVEQAAWAVRQRVARTHRLDVVVAGPRATARVLSLLPAAGPLVGLALGISPVRLYSGVGGGCALLGLLLLLGGRAWCSRLLRGAGRPLAASRTG